MNNALNPLPINQFAFEKIRREKMIYVDKTQLIYNMVSNPDYYFLSRPRRFGKSLLVSILKHLYLGHKEYFKGLWIDKNTEWEWKEWPVILFDFNSISNSDDRMLIKGLASSLNRNAKKYNIQLSESDLKEKFIELITVLNEETNSKVVVLVDEYDKPIIDHLDDEEQIQIAKKNRRVMKEFYGVLKDNEAGPLVEFLFITGVSKFSQVSVFSELNTLTDLTMDENYATLVGYTQEELDTYFVDWINQWSKKTEFSPQAIKQQLKQRYNGFRFSISETYVYNPISILNALKKQSFGSYWFRTATPTFLIKLLLKSDISIPEIEQAQLTPIRFDSFEPDNINIIALMFQTGYLTIKNVVTNKLGNNMFSLDFPNVEVKEAFLELLMIHFAQLKHHNSNYLLILQDLMQQRFQSAVNTMQTVFERIPRLESHDSQFFHHFFYMMINSACPSSRIINKNDKMMILIDEHDQQVAINFSCQYSVNELLKQISTNITLSPDLHKFAIHFDTDQRKIDDWDVEMPKPKPVEIPKSLQNTIKTIKIFLDSSKELSQERQEMALLIQKENNQLIKQGWYLELVIWEDLLHSFQGELIQDYFNEKMLECDVVVVVIGSKVGNFTQEEFKLAWEHLKKGHCPKYLFVYVKNISISTHDRAGFKNYNKVLDLIETIEEKEQLYENFKNPVDFVYKFKSQLAHIMKANL
jgi:hypothetical protein